MRFSKGNRYPGKLGLIAMTGLIVATVGLAAADQIELLRQPTNTAQGLSLGQGLDRVHSAEPLGKGRFRVRLLNRTVPIEVEGLGVGSSYTGHYGGVYGLTNGLDLGLMVPFYFDKVGSLNKYGTSDIYLSVKWSKPAIVGGGLHKGLLLSLGVPLGYKGEHALDNGGGVRPFSNSSLDLGLQGLMDFHWRYASVYLNGGYFRSGNTDISPELAYGVGLEIGRQSRWLGVKLGYQTRTALGSETGSVGLLNLGLRLRLFKGIEVEVGREIGFVDHPIKSVNHFGLRFHGRLSGGRRLQSRYVLYLPPPRPKRDYVADRALRLAIVDFSGFEELAAGRRLVEKIRTQLAPHDSLEIIDVNRYAGVPNRGMLSAAQALEVAKKLKADIVVTGRVARYEINRFAGREIPYLFAMPETKVEVKLEYRVLSFLDKGGPGRQMETHVNAALGMGRGGQKIRILPADRQDITAVGTAVEMASIQEAALDNLVLNLLASLAEKYSWMPPEFTYAN